MTGRKQAKTPYDTPLSTGGHGRILPTHPIVGKRVTRPRFLPSLVGHELIKPELCFAQVQADQSHARTSTVASALRAPFLGHTLAVKRQLTSRTLASPRAEETNTQKMLIMPSSRITITLKGGERVVGEYINKRLAPAAINEGQSTQMTRSNDVLLATPKPPAGLSIQVLTKNNPCGFQSIRSPVSSSINVETNGARDRRSPGQRCATTFFILWVGNSLDLETSETTLTLALAGAYLGVTRYPDRHLTSAIPGARTEVQLGDEWSFE